MSAPSPATPRPVAAAPAAPQRRLSSLRPGTLVYVVYTALNELQGVPMTSQEIADETGLSLKTCCAYVSYLRGAGLVHSAVADAAQGYRKGVHVHWTGERISRSVS